MSIPLSVLFGLAPPPAPPKIRKGRKAPENTPAKLEQLSTARRIHRLKLELRHAQADLVILGLARRNGTVSLKEITWATKLSKTTAYMRLLSLAEKGKIVHDGRREKSAWRLP